MDELEKRVSSIVEKVLAELMVKENRNVQATLDPRSRDTVDDSAQSGVFQTVDQAIDAAERAYCQYTQLSNSQKETIIAAMREAALDNAEHLARQAVQETKLGRYEDKIGKNTMAANLTPGMEDLTTEACAGAKETVFVEYGAYGVAASITPATNPTSTIINHAISLLAAGNSVCFAPHPSSARCAKETIQILNQAIAHSGGPQNLIVMCEEISLDTVTKILQHPKIKLVIATGGAGLLHAALQSGKKCIAGGPGNPPVVVDETADIDLAATCIVDGASFDCNILCICEKETFAVDCVFDDLMAAFAKNDDVVCLSRREMEQLADRVVESGHIKKEFVGKSPSYILRSMGKDVDEKKRLIVGETLFDYPLVSLEQLMPVMPVVRVTDFEQAVAYAKQSEHGYRHTASIFSKDLERVTHYAQEMEVTLLCHNTPSYTGLGANGAGKYTSTLAGPTGEGVTTAKTFARQRRYIAPALT